MKIIKWLFTPVPIYRWLFWLVVINALIVVGLDIWERIHG